MIKLVKDDTLKKRKLSLSQGNVKELMKGKTKISRKKELLSKDHIKQNKKNLNGKSIFPRDYSQQISLIKEKRMIGASIPNEDSLQKSDNESLGTINEAINVGKLMLRKKNSQQFVDSSFNKYNKNSSEFSDYFHENKICQDTPNHIPNKFNEKVWKVKSFKKDVLVKQHKNLVGVTNMPSSKWQLLAKSNSNGRSRKKKNFVNLKLQRKNTYKYTKY